MRKQPPSVAAEPARPRGDRFVWWLVLAAAVTTPLVMQSTAKDPFRLPKDLTLEAFAIAIAAAAAIVVLVARSEIPALFARRKREALFVLAIAAWTLITTLASTNRTISVQSLIWVASCCTVFLAAMALAAREPLHAMYVAFAPAVINSLVVALQTLHIWSPFPQADVPDPRLLRTGFVGNPNDVGAYLVLPILASVAAAVVERGRRRTLLLATALVSFIAVAMTVTMTALIAIAAGIVVLLAFVQRRVAIGVVIAAAIVFAILVGAGIGPGKRVVSGLRSLRAGNFFELTSYRTPAYLAALAMVRDHPLTGVGPDCFGFWYLPYKVTLLDEHPEYLKTFDNFREVHNDHLQVAATTGLPGYALFVAALIWLARLSFAPPGDDPRRRFVRYFALPAAVAFAVLALAQFPLESAAATSTVVFFGGLAFGWKDAE